jgi:rhodanese-related sulfurtransferase
MVYAIAFLLLLYSLYKRYVPICHVKSFSFDELKTMDPKEAVFLDVRDYTETPIIPDAIRLPLAYFKRNRHILPNKPIVVIASNALEKNVAIRLLKRYRFHVEGYYIEKSEQVHEWKLLKCH